MSCRKCKNICGVSRKKCVDTVPIIGHRGMMGDQHFSRYCGVSQQCCPTGYYRGSSKEMDKAADAVTVLFNKLFFVKKNETDEEKQLRIKARDYKIAHKLDKVDPICHTRTIGCDGFELSDELNIDYSMHNDKYKSSDFLPFMSFAH